MAPEEGGPHGSQASFYVASMWLSILRTCTCPHQFQLLLAFPHNTRLMGSQKETPLVSKKKNEPLDCIIPSERSQSDHAMRFQLCEMMEKAKLWRWYKAWQWPRPKEVNGRSLYPPPNFDVNQNSSNNFFLETFNINEMKFKNAKDTTRAL